MRYVSQHMTWACYTYIQSIYVIAFYPPLSKYKSFTHRLLSFLSLVNRFCAAGWWGNGYCTQQNRAPVLNRRAPGNARRPKDLGLDPIRIAIRFGAPQRMGAPQGIGVPQRIVGAPKNGFPERNRSMLTESKTRESSMRQIDKSTNRPNESCAIKIPQFLLGPMGSALVLTGAR